VDTQIRLVILQNVYHNHQRPSYVFSRLCWSNSDVHIIRDHLILIEEKHIFCLDLSLLILKVCSSTFICLKVVFFSCSTTLYSLCFISFRNSPTSSSFIGLFISISLMTSTTSLAFGFLLSF